VVRCAPFRCALAQVFATPGKSKIRLNVVSYTAQGACGGSAPGAVYQSVLLRLSRKHAREERFHVGEHVGARELIRQKLAVVLHLQLNRPDRGLQTLDVLGVLGDQSADYLGG